MELTKNEKTTLKALIDDGRASDTSISKKLKISVQAVRKIRNKLEESGVIKKYSTLVDYEKVGIKVFAIVELKLIDKSGKIDLFESPNIIGSFRLPETNITNIFIAGFASLDELDNYFAEIKGNYMGKIEIQNMHIISNIGMMKNSPSELLKKKIDEL